MVERAIRKAAAAICVRDGGTGEPEVLVVERSPESRFLPGYVAFPGGAVEPGDDARAERWFGSADDGHRAAALRELIEEVGLAVTSGGVVTSQEMAPIDEFPPGPDAIPEVCHWVAPPEVPVRFDAHYFAVSVDPGIEPVVGRSRGRVGMVDVAAGAPVRVDRRRTQALLADLVHGERARSMRLAR